jgi:hypothetical protein
MLTANTHKDGAEAARAADAVSFDDKQSNRRSDRELADAARGAVRHLQDVMDDLVKAGLTVEPAFKIVTHRSSNLGHSADSYQVDLDVWRKLS